jgi:hypothetical protein
MPMSVSFTVWGLVAFVALFFLVGFAVTVKAMRDARRERMATERRGARPLTLRERARLYEGPITPDLTRLNAPLRVGLEFICALFGLPGLGWALSSRVLVGLILMLSGGIFAWCLYPVFLSVTGLLARDVYLLVIYLPVLAAISAGTLAAAEVRTVRRRQRREE